MPAPSEALDLALPLVPREFRAAWIATVDNIDWPSRPGLSVAEQQAELRGLFDRAVDLNLNAIIFQVRPTADAFYASDLEPWSYYLTGMQGQAPEPFYDPLAFAVEEAHRRGLQLHAWFNPYRTRHPTTQGPVAETHISRTQPEIVRTYGELGWLDPGEPRAADHTVAVVLDVVRRYDIDGVHFDDYFYPYPIRDDRDQKVGFPDDPSWARAQASGETRPRDDWRRANVDGLIERLYRAIKAEKPHVAFGISPFGIWRPGHPDSIRGFDAYAELYADARLWLQEGWLDYFAPQLYWSIASEGQSYPVLLDWWTEQNLQGRHLWPGNYTSRILFDDNRGWRAEEILEQIEVTRERAGATGNIHFSMKALLDSSGVVGDQLRRGPYAAPALIPASPWLDAESPATPQVQQQGRRLTLSTDEAVWQWVIRTQQGTDWSVEILPGSPQTYTVPYEIDVVAISAVDRVGNESAPTVMRFTR